MVTLQIPQQKEELTVNRLIGSYPANNNKAPLVIAIGGVHGNEPSGVFAIKNVLRKLEEKNISLRGKFVGIAGNLKGLNKNLRYIDEDLNRLFLDSKIKAMETSSELCEEEKELDMILQIMKKITKAHEHVFFIDCHTTSSPSMPYISVNEYQKSMDITRQFPLFSVIGLEKSIPGCLAEYYNEKGFHGFTFEAGQHHNLSSVENHEAAIWMLLTSSGVLPKKDFEDYQHYYDILATRTEEKRRNFCVVEHYKIKKEEQFKMKPGYVNFQEVAEGEVLATNEHRTIRSAHTGRILMPLYQLQGDDGYFVLKQCS